MHADIPIGTLVTASHGLGMDGSLNFYRELEEVTDAELTGEFLKQTNWPAFLPSPYIIPGTPALIRKLSTAGITASRPQRAVFTGPRAGNSGFIILFRECWRLWRNFPYKENRIINFEMETSSLYGFGKMLGHQVASICVLLANRATGEYTKSIREDEQKLIAHVLHNMTA